MTRTRTILVDSLLLLTCVFTCVVLFFIGTLIYSRRLEVFLPSCEHLDFVINNYLLVFLMVRKRIICFLSEPLTRCPLQAWSVTVCPA